MGPGQLINQVMTVSCTVVQCGGLGDPPNGEVSLDGVVFGSQAVYNCSAGYNLFGDAARSCEADGRWSGSQPACEGDQHLYYISIADFSKEAITLYLDLLLFVLQ